MMAGAGAQPVPPQIPAQSVAHRDRCPGKGSPVFPARHAFDIRWRVGDDAVLVHPIRLASISGLLPLLLVDGTAGAAAMALKTPAVPAAISRDSSRGGS